jgi:hypothetical protein
VRVAPKPAAPWWAPLSLCSRAAVGVVGVVGVDAAEIAAEIAAGAIALPAPA